MKMIHTTCRFTQAELDRMKFVLEEQELYGFTDRSDLIRQAVYSFLNDLLESE